ncbi:MAG: MATE family efflux transporter, partial [Eubacterium sp.]|nr:MATE family efflux transporter [Eubacterium sp.]
MKRVDFSNGRILQNILQTSLPLLVAQVLNLLYNIVDRIYIARIPEVGTAALGAVGLCFPLIVIITAFTNLYGIGSTPLFAIERGKRNETRAAQYMNTAFFLLLLTAVILTVVGELT